MSQDLSTTQLQKRIRYFDLLELGIIYILTFILSLIFYNRLNFLNVAVDTIAPKDSYINSIYIFSVVIIFTLIIILIIKYVKNVIKYIEFFVVFIALLSLVNLYLGLLYSAGITALLIFLKYRFDNKYYSNLITVLVCSFVSSLIAYTYGIFPIIVLIGILSVYDIIAVFYTKHMVYLAKNISSNSSFLFQIGEKGKNHVERKPNSSNKSNKRGFNIGTGDFVLPMIVILKFSEYSFLLSILSLVLMIVILYATLEILRRNLTVALPALPLQGFALIIIYIFL